MIEINRIEYKQILTPNLEKVSKLKRVDSTKSRDWETT